MQQIFLDREVRKDLASFRNIADAERGDAKRRPAGGLGAENLDVAFARRGQSHQAAQGRGLAGAVAAEQRGHLAFGGFEADAVQDVALAVIGVEPFGGQSCGHAACPR
jgi:hypothetical protein